MEVQPIQLSIGPQSWLDIVDNTVAGIIPDDPWCNIGDESEDDSVVTTQLSNPRVKLIAKPAQSGKTAIIIKLVQEQFGEDDIGGDYTTINFIFNANNLLLTKQTSKRFKRDLDNTLHDVVEFSSAKSGDAKSWRELLGYIITGASNVMVCNNKQRVTDIPFVVNALLTNPNFPKYRINLWIDEADKFISSIAKLRHLVVDERIHLWCITATPDRLFSEFGNQNVYKLQHTTEPNYHGWKDNNVHILPSSENSVGFVKNVLDGITGKVQPTELKKLNFKETTLWKIIKRETESGKTFTRKRITTFMNELKFGGNTPEQSLSVVLQNLRNKNRILFLGRGIYMRCLEQPTMSSDSKIYGSIQKNTRWFIPGQTRKVTHYAIRDLCVSHGFAVFVVNGDGVELTVPGKTAIGPVTVNYKDDELCTTFDKLTQEHELWNYPVSVTGNMCVSRGISIQTPTWLFTHGIVSYCSNRSETSQLVGRFNGNIKSWSGWDAEFPIVYTTQECNDIAEDVETQSRKLAELAWSKGIDEPGDTTSVTPKEFRGLSSMTIPSSATRTISDDDKSYKEFTDRSVIKEYGRKYFKKNLSPGDKAPNTLCDADGSNPSIDYIINRWWGIKPGAVRCVATNNHSWLVYWNKDSYPDAPV